MQLDKLFKAIGVLISFMLLGAFGALGWKITMVVFNHICGN
jgi:hypothetical protein